MARFKVKMIHSLVEMTIVEVDAETRAEAEALAVEVCEAGDVPDWWTEESTYEPA
jgi:hypothetical protein